MHETYNPWADRDPAWKRYETDPVFRRLVDSCEYMLDYAQVTPSELREAVMYAAIRAEYRILRKGVIVPENFAVEDAVLNSVETKIKESYA